MKPTDKLVETLPTPHVIRTRLSDITREAAVLRRLLRIVDRAEKANFTHKTDETESVDGRRFASR